MLCWERALSTPVELAADDGEVRLVLLDRAGHFLFGAIQFLTRLAQLGERRLENRIDRGRLLVGDAELGAVVEPPLPPLAVVRLLGRRALRLVLVVLVPGVLGAVLRRRRARLLRSALPRRCRPPRTTRAGPGPRWSVFPLLFSELATDVCARPGPSAGRALLSPAAEAAGQAVVIQGVLRLAAGCLFTASVNFAGHSLARRNRATD